MNVLITGGSGFIGSYLAERLLESGDNVYVVDDLSTGSMGNIADLMDNVRFHFKAGDICNYHAVEDFIEKCDVVYHLAAAVGVYLIIDQPVKTIEVNVKGTETILALAAKNNTRVIFASTSEVYGKGTQIPFKENGDIVFGSTTKRRWSYACSKAIDEFLALAYWREKQLPVVIVRLFNTTGPRQTGKYGMVVPRLVGQSISNDPMTVFGDGTQTRCFAHVKDVVRALELLKDRDDVVGEIFNIGDDHSISIKDLAHKIKEATNSDSEIQYIPYAEAYDEGFEDMSKRIPDLHKMRTLLNCRFHFNIDHIIRDVRDCYIRETTSS